MRRVARPLLTALAVSGLVAFTSPKTGCGTYTKTSTDRAGARSRGVRLALRHPRLLVRDPRGPGAGGPRSS